MGGGVALIDGDGDGWLDIYLCDGGPIVAGAGRADPPCRYYRNNRDGTFADETVAAGAPGPSYAMGAAVGDFDGDGRDDLFVTGWRDQRLYRNRGGGRFEDVTQRAGVASAAWSTSAAFADLDGDGDLDLYVANYLDYDPATAPFCSAPDGRRDYCGPEDFPAQPDRLYRNNGDGTFADETREAGIVPDDGRGLGVLIADLVGDPRPDIFVANDGTPCRLFENRGGLRFAEVGHAAGVARDGRGEAPAGMGVALGDLDGDGLPELVVANFLGRGTIAFQARGGGTYLDASNALGLAAPTRDVLGFGLALADFDADGRLDLIQVNGHVLDRARLGVPLAMRPTLLRNPGGRLSDASAGAGPWFARPTLGRGLAVGDLDRDGRPDVVVNALDAPAAILRNVSAAGRSIALDLVGAGPGAGGRARPRHGRRPRPGPRRRRRGQLPVVLRGSDLSRPGRRPARRPPRSHLAVGTGRVVDGPPGGRDRPARRGDRRQYESALTTSPPDAVAMAAQVVGLTLSLMNLTEPSRKPTFTPPGWFELAPIRV